MLRIAVTGGSGQLGTLLLRRLVEDRQVGSIISIDRRPPLVASGKLRSVEADVRDSHLRQHFEGCDALVHLAFLVSGKFRREVAESVNIDGSKNVFEQAREAGVSHFVFVSSIAAYGVVPGHRLPLLEDSPRHYQDNFIYAATKYKVEEYLDAFERAYPHVVVSRARPAMLIGAHMDNPMGFMLRRNRIPVTQAPMPVVWDEDVADALALMIRQRAVGAFNLAADDPLPSQELAAAAGLRQLYVYPRAVARALAHLSPGLERLGMGPAFDPVWVDVMDVPMVVSSARARQVLSWQPRCATAADVLKKYKASVPSKTDRRLVWFFRAAHLYGQNGKMLDELRGVCLSIHVCLTGPGGGDFGISIEGGRMAVRRAPPRPPTATITLRAKLLLKLLAGQANWSQEVMTGRVLAAGQAHAPMVVAAMISKFRSGVNKPGVAGRIARLLEHWFAAGGAE
ncbi:MAG: NAD-dependent epimerase/dehydratase [Planctomycetaceae bacterium]|nr:NAD-dependent epimerase/dehydratase [Planctomycetaceae bacterium]